MVFWKVLTLFFVLHSHAFIVLLNELDIEPKMDKYLSSANGESLSRRRLADEQFPETLEGFGYRFNEKGQLRQIEDPEQGYVFEVKPEDKNYNQKRYEALGSVSDYFLFCFL